MHVSNLLRYSSVCPFLGHSTPATLRNLASVGASATGATALTVKAAQCPMMGPQLMAKKQRAAARGYASVAGNRDVEQIHKVSSNIA